MRGPARNPLGQTGWPPLPWCAAGHRDQPGSTYRKGHGDGHAPDPRRHESPCGSCAGCCPVAVEERRLCAPPRDQRSVAEPAGVARVGAVKHRYATGPLQLRRKSTRSPGPRTRSLRSGPSAFRPRLPRHESQRRAHNSTTAASGRSSTGRAPVSNTGGWGFESLRPCASWKVPRAPDPRPGREAGEQRGTGLTVTWPWDTFPDSDPSDGE